MSVFVKENEFEQALCEHLIQHGWSSDVIMQPTEEDLINNWANIIYDNNRDQALLGNYPLTSTEMQQIIDQVNLCGSPYKVNRLINGQQVCIKRDNPLDTRNYGNEVYLKIFDAREISAGQSRYQIVRQPRFRTSNSLGGDRRGDVMLLINGMPVIHIELKRSNVDVSQAVYQIKRYMHEGVFSSGIFSMVQIFVAMTPEKSLYFANPGSEDRFLTEFQFHWADFNNEEVSNWNSFSEYLLSIPMAHQLVGYYTIADDKDKTLKVLRSYQYYAVNSISDVTHQTHWDDHQHRGGYIWHTTGSGKTMTSFKSAQLIANSGDADKVVFLMDRIELSTQSLDEYRGFAGEDDSIQDTQNTAMLLSKLLSTDNDDRLIVTSIQKMSNINPDHGIDQASIEAIGKKRLVLILDECHRSVFGQMLIGIKNTFPRALLFGFTGTPVFEENAHNEITTGTLFGDMLHKYTIANGIPDHNVLGFDPYRECTYEEEDLRERAAFSVLGVKSLEEIEDDEEAMNTYNRFMTEMPMVSTYTENGEIRHGIEYYLPKDLYQQEIHHLAVADDIVTHRDQLSKNKKFHAILATQNIPEAIEYYHIFKEKYPSMNVVAVFDNNIDNSDEGIAREDALLEMLADYNAKYHTTFQLSTYGKYKKDVAKRLAHKKPYVGIECDHNLQIDLLIVVTQMLTGYDSKWVNTLYVDKVMKYVDVIQSFSRTNRLFGPDKPFGIIKYYTFPYTMEQNIQDALEVYADRPLGVFVDKLEDNLMNINSRFLHIRDIFHSHELFDFERLPDTREDRNMFAKDFSTMTHLIEGAKLQGFLWEKNKYEFRHGDTFTYVTMELDEATYLILLQRYRELFTGGGSGGGGRDFDYPIDTYITETGTGTIDAEYINSKFMKFIKNLYMEGPGSELTKAALKELHKTFASLSQKDQRTATIILHDLQRGDLHLESGKTIQDYINEYQLKELRGYVMILSEATGINSSMLLNLINSGVTEQTLNEFNRFEDLKITLDLMKTRIFLQKVKGVNVPARMVVPEADKILRMFILDPEARERIITAYLNDEVTIDTVVIEPATTEEDEEQPENETEQGGGINELDLEKAKEGVDKIISVTLADVMPTLGPKEDVIDSVFDVLTRETINDLDSVELFISRAFNNLFAKQSSIVDKFVSFNLLATKFEAYLRKLYYVLYSEEVQPQEGKDKASWGEVIHSFGSLWGLKHSQDNAHQLLYSYLMKVKKWRNDESHLSPTASEQEVEEAINIVITMYFFATGSCLRTLRAEVPQEATITPSITPYNIVDDSNETLSIAAGGENREMDEDEQRSELFKRCLTSLWSNSYGKSPFSKQRHWVSVYRVAADYGFVIEGDFDNFKDFIDNMHFREIPCMLNTILLERECQGVFAKHLDEWTSEGLVGRDLTKYVDLKRCAVELRKIVKHICNIND